MYFVYYLYYGDAGDLSGRSIFISKISKEHYYIYNLQIMITLVKNNKHKNSHNMIS